MSLDYETFKNVENKAHIVRYICTSNNAKICLNKILEKNNVSNQNVCVCYQDRFHYNKNDWKNALK
jgi:hypothetical protein